MEAAGKKNRRVKETKVTKVGSGTISNPGSASNKGREPGHQAKTGLERGTQMS